MSHGDGEHGGAAGAVGATASSSAPAAVKSVDGSGAPPSTKEGTAWHAMPMEDVLAALQSTDEGLSKPEAAARLSKHGPNRITPGKGRTLLHIIWDNTCNIITLILVVAAIISGVFQEWIEFGFVLLVVVCNVSLGTYQEGKAEAATKAITAMAPASALVMRNGRRAAVDAVTLVPGDVVFLASGDRLPADVRWLETSTLQVTEAMLTGESTPISKSCALVRADAPLGDRTCMGFSGTLVYTGQGTAVVVETGDRAQIGRIQALMSSVVTAKTPLLVQVEAFGLALSIICIIIALITFFVAQFAYRMELKNSFSAAISVAVAMVPEGLPTVIGASVRGHGGTGARGRGGAHLLSPARDARGAARRGEARQAMPGAAR